jgi:5-formyltetrahydrofolate cyclo-ligase
LRRELRAARRALDPTERAAADRQILSVIRRVPAFRAARRVAMFFAFDGEPDLSPLLSSNRRLELFAPVIIGTDMHFAALGRDTLLVPNHFGIPEPADPELIDPRALDLVLTPLVAFDTRGNRLGVGAGYYDRCFSFLRQRRIWHRPKLLGTAYALQQVPSYEPNAWDVPLWAAVTEHGLQGFR